MTEMPRRVGRGLTLRVNFFVSFVHEQGTYFRFHNLAIGLTQLGHRVNVFAGDVNSKSRSRLETRDGVPYHIVPESPLNRVSGFCCDPFLVARRFARRYPPCDVAHLFQPFPSAAAAWHRSGAKVRCYDWDDLWIGGLMAGPNRLWRDYWPRWVAGFLEQRLPRSADHVTAISSFLADLAWQRGARAVSVLNSGSWAAAPQDRKTARRQLGLQTEALYAGFMGRTAAELPWCLEALAENCKCFPKLRLAVCGASPTYLEGLPAPVRERIDYLGQLTPTEAKAFAGCLDLALLPLEDNAFNRSRLPQKFGDHLAAGAPLLCSAVGECARLLGRFPWAIPAGTTRDEWLHAFRDTLGKCVRGEIPPFDAAIFQEHMSWEGLSRQLEKTYQTLIESGRRLAPRPLVEH